MRRKKRLWRVVVTYPGRVTEELVDALDYKEAERKVRRNNQGATSVRAILMLGQPS